MDYVNEYLAWFADTLAFAIAARQDANGMWRGSGPYNDGLYGGSVILEFGTYRGYTSVNGNGLPTESWPTICPLFANPFDRLQNLTLATGGPAKIADRLKHWCDAFPLAGGGTRQLCYPKHWLFDTEQTPVRQIQWHPEYVTIDVLVQHGNIENCEGESPRNETEAVLRRADQDRAFHDLWKAGPDTFGLPAYDQVGSPGESPLLYQWFNSCNLEVHAWALARAFRDPMAAVFPSLVVADYESIVCRSASTLYRLATDDIDRNSCTITHAHLDAQMPVLYPDLHAGPTGWGLKEWLSWWRGKLDACDPSVPIIPWIAHPDTADAPYVAYGGRDYFLELVRMCCLDFGVSQFAVYGFYGPPYYYNWNDSTILSLINEALEMVRPFRVPMPVFRRTLDEVLPTALHFYT